MLKNKILNATAVVFAAGVFSTLWMGTTAKAVNQSPYSDTQTDLYNAISGANKQYFRFQEGAMIPLNQMNDGLQIVQSRAVDTQSQMKSQNQEWQTYYPVTQSVELNGAPTEDSSQEVVAQNNTLTNNTSQPLNLSTSSTQFTKTNGTSVTTSKAYNLGVKESSKFNIVLVKEKISVDFSYNYSNSNTQTQSQSIQYTIPSQQILVKPGHTVRVETVMDLGTATGALNLTAQLNGGCPFAGLKPESGLTPYSATAGLGDLVSYLGGNYRQNGQLGKFTYVDPNTVNYVGGQASYTSNYYSNMQTKVTDLNDNTVSFYKVNNFSKKAL